VPSIFTAEYRIFLRQLIAARKDSGLTQTAVAEKLRKHQSFVSKYERGERRLDFVEFLKIAGALKIEPCAFIRALSKETTKANR
jgi:transcriptional regulator with XRE-family HTH domain